MSEFIQENHEHKHRKQVLSDELEDDTFEVSLL